MTSSSRSSAPQWESLREAIPRLEAGTPPPSTAGLFGASIDPDEAALVLIPVPWDATVSYGDGTSQGPATVLAASHQLDLEDAAFAHPYRAGITMLPEDAELAALNAAARKKVVALLDRIDYEASDPELVWVNDASRKVNERVYTLSQALLAKGKIPAVLGGDHSSPYGLLRALGEKHAKDGGIGVLHFDAHLDLRDAYEGFQYSHASIFHNVMEEIPGVTKLVQIGIRDYSRDEAAYQRHLGARAEVYYARDVFRRKAKGESWDALTRELIAKLPRNVYVSFDIDGLDPAFCPSTGTPVPGGLSYDEAAYIVEELAKSGRTIVGFDLCEVAPGDDGDEWDANVGARMLYRLCAATLASNGKCAVL